MVNILPLLVAIPLGAAFLLPLLEKSAAGPRLSRILAVIISTALMALSLLFLTADNITYWMGGWTPDSGALGICLVLDNLSAFMLALVALVTLVATLFSCGYWPDGPHTCVAAASHSELPPIHRLAVLQRRSGFFLPTDCQATRPARPANRWGWRTLRPGLLRKLSQHRSA